MSNLKPIDSIVRQVHPHWVGNGFPVRSMFSYHQEAEAFDPFLLLDYAGPQEFPSGGAPRGVEEHPHRGFETVTIVYQGEVAHRDSSGSRGTIGPGDVQWMTAASGVVHEEFHGERFTRDGGVLEMVQLWVNLPAADKRSPPKYQEIKNAQIPVVSLPDNAGSARVIAGELLGARGPAETFTPINLWDLSLNAGSGARLPIPPFFTALLVVQRGSVLVNGAESLAGVELVRFGRDGEAVSLEPREAARALLLSGRPIGEPIVGHGPFVMNTPDEISQAIRDYKAGKMGRLS